MKRKVRVCKRKEEEKEEEEEVAEVFRHEMNGVSLKEGGRKTGGRTGGLTFESGQLWRD